ncbi:MAG: ParB N-terminal domain-containing protein [Candidatus Aminicenantes bacterium]|jgi:ParB family chromosome partitioning protein
MSNDIEKSLIKEAEKKLMEKGCKKIRDHWLIPLDILKVEKRFDFRTSRDSEKLKSMTQDILHKGILNPPTAVYSSEDNELILVLGFGRVKSLKMLNKNSVLCRILLRKKIMPLEIHDLAVSDNVQREEIKPLELALLYRSLLIEAGLTQKELAKRIHKSETYLSEILGPLKKLTDEEIEKILTSGLSRSQIVELVKIGDRKLRSELMQKKESVRTIRKLTAKRKNNKEKRSSPRIFKLSCENIKTSLGDAKISVKIEFPSDIWGNENIIEVLNQIIVSIKESSMKENHQMDFLPFDDFKEVQR